MQNKTSKPKFTDSELQYYSDLEKEMIRVELEILHRIAKENPIVAYEFKRIIKKNYGELYTKIFLDPRFDEWLKIPPGEIEYKHRLDEESHVQRERTESKEFKKIRLPKK
jgi:hypothetical protein